MNTVYISSHSMSEYLYNLRQIHLDEILSSTNRQHSQVARNKLSQVVRTSRHRSYNSFNATKLAARRVRNGPRCIRVDNDTSLDGNGITTGDRASLPYIDLRHHVGSGSKISEPSNPAISLSMKSATAKTALETHRVNFAAATQINKHIRMSDDRLTIENQTEKKVKPLLANRSLQPLSTVTPYTSKLTLSAKGDCIPAPFGDRPSKIREPPVRAMPEITQGLTIPISGINETPGRIRTLSQMHSRVLATGKYADGACPDEPVNTLRLQPLKVEMESLLCSPSPKYIPQTVCRPAVNSTELEIDTVVVETISHPLHHNLVRDSKHLGSGSLSQTDGPTGPSIIAPIVAARNNDMCVRESASSWSDWLPCDDIVGLSDGHSVGGVNPEEWVVHPLNKARSDSHMLPRPTQPATRGNVPSLQSMIDDRHAMDNVNANAGGTTQQLSAGAEAEGASTTDYVSTANSNVYETLQLSKKVSRDGKKQGAALHESPSNKQRLTNNESKLNDSVSSSPKPGSFATGEYKKMENTLQAKRELTESLSTGRAGQGGTLSAADDKSQAVFLSGLIAVIGAAQATSQMTELFDENGKLIQKLQLGESADDIDHCEKCGLGLWKAPSVTGRFISLTMLFLTFADTFKSHPGHFTKIVHSRLTIYGLKELIRRETEIASTTIIVMKDRNRPMETQLDERLSLADCGFEGTDWFQPAEHVLYYDYTSDFSACPLLTADHYFTGSKPKRQHNT